MCRGKGGERMGEVREEGLWVCRKDSHGPRASERKYGEYEERPELYM